MRQSESCAEHIAGSARGATFRRVACWSNVATSVMRHVGRAYEVATADGVVTVQTGRDLSSVKTLIGTVAISLILKISRRPIGSPRSASQARASESFPRGASGILRDPMNILPLLANVSRGLQPPLRGQRSTS